MDPSGSTAASSIQKFALTLPFAEAQRAGCSGGEGIEQRDLDDGIAFLAASDKAARVGCVHADAWLCVEAAGKIGERISDQTDYVRVQLHRVDMARAVIQGK